MQVRTIYRLLLKDNGIENALINLGGTVYAIGQERNIGIKNPFVTNSPPIAEFLLKDKAIGTSGSYERYFFHNGIRYHHIIDPRFGRPSQSGLASVSLIGDSAAILDAFATAAFILGAKNALPAIKKHNIEAIFIFDTGIVQITPGIRNLFFLKSGH